MSQIFQGVLKHSCVYVIPSIAGNITLAITLLCNFLISPESSDIDNKDIVHLKEVLLVVLIVFYIKWKIENIDLFTIYTLCIRT